MADSPFELDLDDAPVEDAPVDAAPVEDAPLAEAEFQVSLNPDSELPAPQAVSVPGIDPDVVDTDEHGRLVVDTSPVRVPAALARNLQGIPHLTVEAA
jgi:hypothetical protein